MKCNLLFDIALYLLCCIICSYCSYDPTP